MLHPIATGGNVQRPREDRFAGSAYRSHYTRLIDAAVKRILSRHRMAVLVALKLDVRFTRCALSAMGRKHAITVRYAEAQSRPLSYQISSWPR